MKRLLARLLGRKGKKTPRTKKKTASASKAAVQHQDDTTDPFIELAGLYEKRLLREWAQESFTSPSDPREIAFLVTPWLWTPVPMFNIELALLTRLGGRAARLIVDDEDVAQNASVHSHRAAVRQLVRQVGTHLPVTDISLHPAADGTADLAAARRIADNLAIWWERGETAASEFFVRNPNVVERLAAHLAKVRAVLTTLRPSHFVITGGIFGLSSIYVRVAEELGITYTTYDSNHSVVMLSQNSVACHRRDFPLLMSRLQESLSDQDRAAVQQIVTTVFKKHQQGRDDLGIQMAAAPKRHAGHYDIVVPLNIRWDAAALGCERCFPSCSAWLEALLSWVQQDGRYSICLREHPAGRFPGAASKDDLAPLLQRYRTLGQRLRFIAADEPMNTYDLITTSRIVLPYTSTVGIEAAMLGKPVITHTTAYYANVGFCWPAANSEDYLYLVGQALEGRLQVDPQRQQLATTAYYLANCSWFLTSPFNPHPEPFRKWNQLAPRQLIETTAARDIVNALLTDEAVPILIHQNNMAAYR